MDADTLMESAGCDEEAEQGAAPLAELDQAAADSDCNMDSAAVTGAGEVGLVPATPTAEVERLEEGFEEDEEEDDGDEENEFKVGDVVVYLNEREEWNGGTQFVEPGHVGEVIRLAKEEEEKVRKCDVLVKFPHARRLLIYNSYLRRHTDGKLEAIEDGPQPKRLW